MIERDAEMLADIGQPGGIDAPARAGQLHSTDKPPGRRDQAVVLTAARKHPTIEGGVMSHEKLGALHVFPNLRPGLGEGWLIADVAPAQPMDVGESELAAGRANQEGAFGHDASALHIDETYRAGARAAVVGRFEIDGKKCAHGHPAPAGMWDSPR